MCKFKYLRYTITSNGGQEVHVKKRIRKGAVVIADIGNWKKIRKRLG